MKRNAVHLGFVTILIAVIMAFTGTVSFADEIDDIFTKEVKYLDENGDTKTLPRDDYKIILVNKVNIDFKSGIHVPDKSTLSIYGQGVDRDTAGMLRATA